MEKLSAQTAGAVIVGAGALVEKTFEGGRAGELLQVVRSSKDNLGVQLVALDTVEEFIDALPLYNPPFFTPSTPEKPGAFG